MRCRRFDRSSSPSSWPPPAARPPPPAPPPGTAGGGAPPAPAAPPGPGRAGAPPGAGGQTGAAGGTTSTQSGAGGGCALCAIGGPDCTHADAAACACKGCQGYCNDPDAPQLAVSDCVCPSCADDAFCSNPQSCVDDGICDPYAEGCVCADCADHPLCGGGQVCGGGAGGGGGGAGGGPSYAICDGPGEITFAGSVAGATSIWMDLPGAGGLTGRLAGDEACKNAMVGADHVCDYEEIALAQQKGETNLPDITFWVHRTTSIPGNPLPYQPGPSARCDDWTSDASADGEYGEIIGDNVTYHLDDDLGSLDPALPCGGVTRSILCCYACP